MSRISFSKERVRHGEPFRDCGVYEQRKFYFRCDERFIGYGGNKAACLFEMYLSGVSYYVLSDHFIVHQNHIYEEKARKDEVSHVRSAYTACNCSFSPVRENSTRRFTPISKRRLVYGTYFWAHLSKMADPRVQILQALS